MHSRSPKPEGYSWMIPYLTVRDADRAIEFYEEAFGFEKHNCMQKPDGKTGHGEMKYKGNVVMMFAPEGMMASKPMQAPASEGRDIPVNFYVYTDNVDAQFERALQAGAKARQEPEDMFWGDRIATVVDPDGYLWTFGQ